MQNHTIGLTRDAIAGNLIAQGRLHDLSIVDNVTMAASAAAQEVFINGVTDNRLYVPEGCIVAVEVIGVVSNGTTLSGVTKTFQVTRAAAGNVTLASGDTNDNQFVLIDTGAQTTLVTVAVDTTNQHIEFSVLGANDAEMHVHLHLRLTSLSI